MVPVESGFNNFMFGVKCLAVDTAFKAAKEHWYNLGYKQQLSTYGAVNDHGKIKPVRVEILFDRTPTQRDLDQCLLFVHRFARDGMTLARFERSLGVLLPVLSQFQIEAQRGV